MPSNLGKHKLELLPSYLHHFMPRWKQEFLGKGKKLDKSPYFIILCASALRAVEVLKYVEWTSTAVSGLGLTWFHSLTRSIRFTSVQFGP